MDGTKKSTTYTVALRFEGTNADSNLFVTSTSPAASEWLCSTLDVAEEIAGTPSCTITLADMSVRYALLRHTCCITVVLACILTLAPCIVGTSDDGWWELRRHQHVQGADH